MVSALDQRPVQNSFEKTPRFGKPNDKALLLTLACIAIGTVIAIYALAVHRPVDPNELATLVAYP